MANLLDQLAAMTVVVADTGDIDAIRQFTPRDATTNPSLILAAAQIPAYQNLIDASLRESRDVCGGEAPAEEVVREALDEICVTFGKEILKIVPGRVSTEVDARLAVQANQLAGLGDGGLGVVAEPGIHLGGHAPRHDLEDLLAEGDADLIEGLAHHLLGGGLSTTHLAGSPPTRT